MKTAIVDRADFLYHAELNPVQSPPGLFQLAISTQWRQAKDPNAEHVKTKILLDREGLQRLGALVDAVLQGNVEAAHVNR
jgi:hypothetical protein